MSKTFCDDFESNLVDYFNEGKLKLYFDFDWSRRTSSIYLLQTEVICLWRFRF